MYSATQLRHLVREGLLGLARRRISGTVAVLIMASSLLMLAVFSLVTINLDRVLQGVRGGIDIAVFVEDDIHPDDLAVLRKDLASTQGIARMEFLSREQALERFRADLGEDADLLAAAGSNPLPASFELRLAPGWEEGDRLEDLRRTLSQYPGVEEVVAQVEWVQRLDRINQVFLWVDLVIGLLVLLSALFVISNTVRLTIEESAHQVEIMKLVGATNWFIRWPYLLGGAVQGAAAGAVAMGLLLFAHTLLQQQIGTVWFFERPQMLGFVLFSTLLGGLGSLIALRRHLQL